MNDTREKEKKKECLLNNIYPNISEKRAAIFYSVYNTDEKMYSSAKPKRE